jgi:NAD(P)-dependent dehydrogenase (short-subunit alcohol dehydrogenase family)
VTSTPSPGAGPAADGPDSPAADGRDSPAADGPLGLSGRVALDGAVCLVTGGASGIGRSLALGLAGAGAKVVVADLDLDAALVVADEVGGLAVAGDVREPDVSEQAVAAAEEQYGGLDVAFLNAGVSGGFTAWDDLDLEAYRRTVGVNVDGVVFGVRAALPALRRRGRGSLVVTASLSGLTPTPSNPVYALTKHAVVGLVRSMAPPLAAEAISLNAVCPGFTETPLLDGVIDAFRDQRFPLLTPEEVADAALGLAVGGKSGQCLVCQPGREPVPYAFRGVPGPRGSGQGTPPPTRVPVP